MLLDSDRKAPGPAWGRRRARLLVQLGLLTALFGVGLIAFLVFGPTYGYCEAIIKETVDGTAARREAAGSCGYRSMLEVHGGVPPVVWAAGVTYLLVGLGALAEAGRLPGSQTRPGRGRWLMLAVAAPMVVIGMLAWSLATLLPATILAVVATAVAFATPRAHGPAAGRLAGER